MNDTTLITVIGVMASALSAMFFMYKNSSDKRISRLEEENARLWAKFEELYKLVINQNAKI